jgi:hypothetical protein
MTELSLVPRRAGGYKSAMIKRLFALALLTAPALAQSTPVPVYFAYDGPGANRWLVDNAMHAVMDRPDLALATKRDAKVLEITVVGKVTRDGGDDSKGYSFTLGFYRGGGRLGEASEYCRLDKPSDCTDQLISDITSADTLGR